MLQTPINRAVVQIMQKSKADDIEASTLVAIKNLFNRISVLAGDIAAIQKNSNSTKDQYGNDLGFSDIRQTIASFINGSGGTLYQGDVVVIDSTEGQVTTTTTEGDENVVGVAFSDGATTLISALNLGFVSAAAYSMSNLAVCQRGNAKVRCVTGADAIEIGDYIKAAATARYGKRAHPCEAGIFAQALSKLSANKSGLVKADINPQIGFENYHEAQPFVFKAVYDDDGTITGFSGFLTEEKYFKDITLSTYIEHDYYIYSSDGNLISMIQSMFGVDGVGDHAIKRTLNYLSDKIDQIIQEISG